MLLDHRGLQGLPGQQDLKVLLVQPVRRARRGLRVLQGQPDRRGLKDLWERKGLPARQGRLVQKVRLVLLGWLLHPRFAAA